MRLCSSLIDACFASQVTLYCFLFGERPFQSVNMRELYAEIREQEPVLFRVGQAGTTTGAKLQRVSDDVVALLHRLLDKNPVTRASVRTLRSDAWITGHGTEPLCLAQEVTVVGMRPDGGVASRRVSSPAIALSPIHTRGHGSLAPSPLLTGEDGTDASTRASPMRLLFVPSPNMRVRTGSAPHPRTTTPTKPEHPRGKRASLHALMGTPPARHTPAAPTTVVAPAIDITGAALAEECPGDTAAGPPTPRDVLPRRVRIRQRFAQYQHASPRTKLNPPTETMIGAKGAVKFAPAKHYHGDAVGRKATNKLTPCADSTNPLSQHSRRLNPPSVSATGGHGGGEGGLESLAERERNRASATGGAPAGDGAAPPAQAPASVGPSGVPGTPTLAATFSRLSVARTVSPWRSPIVVKSAGRPGASASLALRKRVQRPGFLDNVKESVV